ncbi:hypothetical protein [Floridanema evergladense]|uniref:Uncharacterized protein n=1 Tax=Floridaenema evergladense BLCC-F167 TaxID=3153639 RepID=A0ABV4WTU9_9CYAN
MVFNCFRDAKIKGKKDKCEWEEGNLRDFVAQFNQTFGSKYLLVECLDKDTTQKQPEVLLQWEGHQNMVIERKTIVYPPNYYDLHQRWHKFFDEFKKFYDERLKSVLPEDVWQLELKVENLPNKDEEIEEVAKKVVDIILEKWNKGQYLGKIRSLVPMPWCFQSLPVIERDENTPNSGIFICEWRTPILDLEDENIDPFSKAAKYVENEISRLIKKAEPKFINYADCLRILILEPCGDIDLIPDPWAIAESIHKAPKPANIDQIWIAEGGYNDDSDLQIEYIRAC